MIEANKNVQTASAPMSLGRNANWGFSMLCNGNYFTNSMNNNMGGASCIGTQIVQGRKRERMGVHIHHMQCSNRDNGCGKERL